MAIYDWTLINLTRSVERVLVFNGTQTAQKLLMVRTRKNITQGEQRLREGKVVERIYLLSVPQTDD